MKEVVSFFKVENSKKNKIKKQTSRKITNETKTPPVQTSNGFNLNMDDSSSDDDFQSF
jgi:hypothetical protein